MSQIILYLSISCVVGVVGVFLNKRWSNWLLDFVDTSHPLGDILMAVGAFMPGVITVQAVRLDDYGFRFAALPIYLMVLYISHRVFKIRKNLRSEENGT